MVCVPTAATDNDVISSFPGWTRPVSVGGLVHVDCSTLTLKGCYVFWYPPNYSRTSLDSGRRHGALTHGLIPLSLLFGWCDLHSPFRHCGTFAHILTRECQRDLVRLNSRDFRRYFSQLGGGAQDALKDFCILQLNHPKKGLNGGWILQRHLEFPKKCGEIILVLQLGSKNTIYSGLTMR